MKNITLILLLFFFINACTEKETIAPAEIKLTINIGNQTWMKENLEVVTYRNGDIIPQVTSPAAWGSLITGAWCYYDNDPANGAIYGKLYNWYAVNDPRGLAPKGWHIPTHAEWSTLGKYLGEDIAGGKMKTTGLTLWKYHRTSTTNSATNESGFSGLPGGYRTRLVGFESMGFEGTWWTATQFNLNRAFLRHLDYDGDALTEFNHDEKEAGLSVRCIKD
jgi:uncharacterized protein (TIGR02145 family)